MEMHDINEVKAWNDECSVMERRGIRCVYLTKVQTIHPTMAARCWRWARFKFIVSVQPRLLCHHSSVCVLPEELYGLPAYGDTWHQWSKGRKRWMFSDGAEKNNWPKYRPSILKWLHVAGDGQGLNSLWVYLSSGRQELRVWELFSKIMFKMFCLLHARCYSHATVRRK